MSTTAIGRDAEDAAAEYLQVRGFEIIARNWRNRWCEIDIVAKHRNKTTRFRKELVIHFVEVKFRKNALHGSGLEFITKTKADQMKKAALNWTVENEWQGDYQIDAVGVDGESGKIEFIENAIGF